MSNLAFHIETIDRILAADEPSSQRELFRRYQLFTSQAERDAFVAALTAKVYEQKTMMQHQRRDDIENPAEIQRNSLAKRTG